MGIIVSITQRYAGGWEFFGTYHEVEGALAVGFGVGLSASSLTLWICYFRRICRVFTYMRSQIVWFWLLIGFCLTVSVLPDITDMSRTYRIFCRLTLIFLFIFAHYFHKRVKLAVSKLIKKGENNQQN